MSDGLRTTYQGEGPQCPCCGRQYTADEGAYYDEQKYTEETCDECGETFDVEVHHSVNWLCTEREREEAPSTLAEIATPSSRPWFPHLDFAGEPMREGQFREPWPMEEESSPRPDEREIAP